MMRGGIRTEMCSRRAPVLSVPRFRALTFRTPGSARNSGMELTELTAPFFGMDARPPNRSRYPLEQRHSLLQVGGAKAFGEPAVDLGQQPSGLFALALALPQ